MRVVFKIFSDAASVLIFRTPEVTRHGSGWVQIDCDTFAARLRQAFSDVLSYEPDSQEQQDNLRHQVKCNIPPHQIRARSGQQNNIRDPRRQLAFETSGNRETLS